MMKDLRGSRLIEVAVIPRPPLEYIRPINCNKIKKKKKDAAMAARTDSIFEMVATLERERRIFQKRVNVERGV